MTSVKVRYLHKRIFRIQQLDFSAEPATSTVDGPRKVRNSIYEIAARPTTTWG